MSKIMLIEHLTVKVTYTVGLGNVEVPKNIFKQLEMAELQGSFDDTDGLQFPDAAEWLRNNIREGDCCGLEYEVEIDEQ
jgi:hypothetical protein